MIIQKSLAKVTRILLGQNTTMSGRIQNPVLVVAIDFGTAYSGYAIQFLHEFDPKDPTKIRAPQAWNGGKQSLMSYKTPTCLLLDENQQIDCFGFEAEEKYADMCMNKTNHTYYYYRRFKMKLQEGQGLKKDSQLEDETKKAMPALKVFSLSIECLKDHLMAMTENEGTGVGMKDILWVLTVPAIWDDAAKAFMKEAAHMAGIEEKHLQIALEPEAASLYCQYLPTDKFSFGGSVKFSDSKPGTTYMVVDLGGGTADITVHEKLPHNQIKEVYKASGGPWGGTAVDSAFWQFLISIAGAPTMSAFQTEQKYDYLDLMKEFECVKRTFSMKMKTLFTIKMPATLNEICRLKQKQTFQQLTEESRHKGSVKFVSDKMRMEPALVETFFKKVTTEIVKHINNILQTTEHGKKVSLILMVGGFSESQHVQDVMRAELSKKAKVLIPQQAGLSVLNGAVIYGRMPESITTRVLRYTYGVKVSPIFIPGVHPERKKIPGKQPRCSDVFSPFMEEGQSVESGFQKVEAYETTIPYQPVMGLNVYICKNGTPSFVTDDGCRFLGKLEVIVPNPTEKDRNLVVVFIFGRTTLQVLAMETEGKHPCETSFELLE